MVAICFNLQTCKKKAPDPKKTVTSAIINRLEANMVIVAGGTFSMGCTAEQGGDCSVVEGPVHAVNLNSFKIGKYEVTQEEWMEIMGSNPSAFGNCSKCPVEKVTWNDIQIFLQKLNAITGGKYRLPTEAEWEYAARGGKSAGFKYSGSKFIDGVAWYSGNSDKKTHLVGQKTANELGLFDMSGNVFEWCNDWYEPGYNRTSPSNNPTGPISGVNRVVRGGSWNNPATSCRVSWRGSNTPDYSGFGFRLVTSDL